MSETIWLTFPISHNQTHDVNRPVFTAALPCGDRDSLRPLNMLLIFFFFFPRMKLSLCILPSLQIVKDTDGRNNDDGNIKSWHLFADVQRKFKTKLNKKSLFLSSFIQIMCCVMQISQSYKNIGSTYMSINFG